MAKKVQPKKPELSADEKNELAAMQENWVKNNPNVLQAYPKFEVNGKEVDTYYHNVSGFEIKTINIVVL